MAKLTGAQRKWLRGQAHSLRPLVRLGKQGLTEGVVREIDAVLDSHELVKVQGHDKTENRELTERLETELGAEVVGLIGHVLILFREQEDPELRRFELPD
ncbi:MAG TPA: ribosome assembly RNA-binding protein YhbY [Thermoanaerobaculia bacterium]|nr:ribosome assembly RNA-binding protein YhbY [Thermoanaerobaculia bacterium]